MRSEIWKNIKGYEGYQVSNHGRVRSFWRRGKFPVILNKARILKPAPASHKYLTVRLKIERGNYKSVCIHRLVAEAFIPNPKNKSQVNHIDSDRKNNKVENLEWVTQRENINHASDAGAYSNLPNGEQKPNSKLTKKHVIKIRDMSSKGAFLQCEIAEKFNVSATTIRNIVKNKKWKHV